ncbi:MAG: pseudouridylate synthase [Bacteroidales bacterium]|nr:pseudouridylate synthase [Candidatus Colimorpha onthohippi]
MKALNEIDISNLIPQRPPILLVDRLVYCDEYVVVSELTIRDDNIFCEFGVMDAAGLIENVAQTCAAGIGYHTIVGGSKVRLGVIGAISNMDIVSTPLVGDKLTTKVMVEEEIFNMTLVRAEVYDGDLLLAKVSMKIALTDKETQE